MAQPATHAAKGRVLRNRREDLGEHSLSEDGEGLLVAEEAGHADEQIPVEQVELLAAAPEPLDVSVHVLGARQHQPALDAPGHGAGLVVREVDAVLGLEHLVHGREAVARAIDDSRRRREAAAPRVLQEDRRHLAGRQHMVGHAGVARRPGHSVELRARRVLDDDQAAGVVDGADAARAVAAASGEDHGHGAPAAVLRERAEEDVDRERELVLLAIPLAEEEAAARDDHLLLGGDEIDVVRRDGHPVLDELDRQLRMPREQLVHQAAKVGGQVLDDDVRHPALAGRAVEESLERLEPAGGGADADDERRRGCVRAGQGTGAFGAG